MKGGLLIREARLRAGLTQRALAERRAQAGKQTAVAEAQQVGPDDLLVRCADECSEILVTVRDPPIPIAQEDADRRLIDRFRPKNRHTNRATGRSVGGNVSAIAAR